MISDSRRCRWNLFFCAGWSSVPRRGEAEIFVWHNCVHFGNSHKEQEIQRAVSSNIIQTVLPMEHDRFFIHLIKMQIDAFSEFLVGFNTDSAQHLFCHLAEETFDHVDPRTMLRCKHKLKSAEYGRKIFPGLPRSVNL